MADPSYITDNVLTDGEAWIALASTTLGSDQPSVTFTSANDGSSLDWCQFMDLFLIANAQGEQAAYYDNGLIQLGTGGGAVDTGSNYPYQRFNGEALEAQAGAGSATGWYFRTIGTSGAAEQFGSVIFHFFDINSGKWKTSMSMAACDINGGGFMRCSSNAWKNQGAITSMKISPGSGNFKQYSRFDLFGILPSMLTTGTVA
jgi:hypothetical protein